MAVRSFFTVFTWEKAIFYLAATAYVAGCLYAMAIQPFLSFDCPEHDRALDYENVSYKDDLCDDIRRPILLFMTVHEVIFARRIVMSVVLGGIIGWERRQADRPAGIRTMAMVSLGACLFTICSTFAFLDGPMNWDASRVSAAIPSGCGFLGSALIFKSSEKGSHEVHGLTTATSLWLSAAVGIACGGGLFFVSSFCCAIMLVVLRFAPRTTVLDDDEEEELNNVEIGIQDYSSTRSAREEAEQLLRPSISTVAGSTRRQSVRQRPQLL